MYSIAAIIFERIYFVADLKVKAKFIVANCRSVRAQLMKLQTCQKRHVHVITRYWILLSVGKQLTTKTAAYVTVRQNK